MFTPLSEEETLLLYHYWIRPAPASSRALPSASQHSATSPAVSPGLSASSLFPLLLSASASPSPPQAEPPVPLAPAHSLPLTLPPPPQPGQARSHLPAQPQPGRARRQAQQQNPAPAQPAGARHHHSTRPAWVCGTTAQWLSAAGVRRHCSAAVMCGCVTPRLGSFGVEVCASPLGGSGGCGCAASRLRLFWGHWYARHGSSMLRAIP
jgi:hypothetical protein